MVYVNIHICRCTHQTSSTDLKVVVHEGQEERGVGCGSQGRLLQIQQVGTIEHVPQCSHIAILQRWGVWGVAERIVVHVGSSDFGGWGEQREGGGRREEG